MADDYIRKQDAVEETLKYIISSGVSNQSTWNECVRTIADTLQDMRPADVVQVVHAMWVHKGCGVFECSKCEGRVITNVYIGEKASERFMFCPHCGAKIDGERKELAE